MPKVSNKCWYYFHNGEQVGPMEQTVLVSKVSAGELKSESLVFKTGWKAWQKLADVKAQLMPSTAVTPPPPPVPASSDNTHSDTQQVLTFSSAENEKSNIELMRQARLPRMAVRGQVIVHNNDNLIFAQSANISAEGLFIKTEKPIFYIGEILKITCRIIDLGSPFNAEAQVVRRSSGVHEPSGYGLYFTMIKPEVVEKIRQITMTSQAS